MNDADGTLGFNWRSVKWHPIKALMLTTQPQQFQHTDKMYLINVQNT